MSSKRKPLPVAPILGIAVLGMLGIWFLISGCGKDPVVPSPPEAAKPAELQYEKWEKPAAVLVLSGEQHGYIEPCGCSESQSGGLARRADLVHDLMKRGWPVAGLDLGGSFRLAKAEAGEELRAGQFVNRFQSKLKFDTQLKVLEDLRYSAVALGFEELLFGGDGLLNNYQSRLNPGDGKVHPVLMGANVVIYDPALGPNRSQTLMVGDVTVGVTAVVGDSNKKRLHGDAQPPDLEIKPPAAVLPEMIETLKSAKTDFNVLLSHGSFAETEVLLKKFPDFAVAICQSGGEEGRDEPQTVGGTLVLQVGWKGKHVGLLAYYPDAEQKFRYELVELDNEHFENDPAVEPHLIAYQKLLEEHSDPMVENPDGSMSPRDPKEFLYSNENMFRGEHPKNGSFVGAAECGQCHTKAYEKWKTSKHAGAYETLKTGRKGQYSQPISRIHDPECLACHVAGWNPQGVFPYPSGFLPEVYANYKNESDRFLKLQGQQCENCHGPGSEHAKLERRAKKDPAITQEALRVRRRQMVLSKAAAEKSLCQKCHDFENSPKFQFEEYWKKVEHPWRD